MPPAWPSSATSRTWGRALPQPSGRMSVTTGPPGPDRPFTNATKRCPCNHVHGPRDGSSRSHRGPLGQDRRDDSARLSPDAVIKMLRQAENVPPWGHELRVVMDEQPHELAPVFTRLR